MPDLNEAAADAGAGVAEGIAAPANFDVNRDATPEDAENLSRIYDLLSDAASDVKAKRSAFLQGFNATTDVAGRETLRQAMETALTVQHDRLFECWETILHMPKGTCVGDATRHSVALQHFGGHLTSTFGIRMTVSDAKALNKLAFGK